MKRSAWWGAALSLVLLASASLSLSLGAVDLPLRLVWGATLDRAAAALGLAPLSTLDYTERETARNAALVTELRLPRVLMAVGVGAGLALGGALAQAVFRTPLADPSLLGATGGASLGAALTLWGGGGVAFLGAAGVLGALAATFIVAQAGRGDATRLLLVGVALNTLLVACVGMVTFVAGARAGDILFWTLGGLSAVLWADVEVYTPILLILGAALPFLAPPLDALALGDASARQLGVRVELVRGAALLSAALLVGVATAFVGTLGLVGLTVPVLLRRLVGASARRLLPISALGGAIFLLWGDLLARLVAQPTEIPLGVVTTLIGGAVFLGVVLSQKHL